MLLAMIQPFKIVNSKVTVMGTEGGQIGQIVQKITLPIRPLPLSRTARNSVQSSVKAEDARTSVFRTRPEMRLDVLSRTAPRA